MDGTGEAGSATVETDGEKIARLERELADAQAAETAEDAAQAPAPGPVDVPPVDVPPGAPVAVDEPPAVTTPGTPADTPPADTPPADEPPKSVLDLLAEQQQEAGSADSPHGFVEALRAVSSELAADGRIVETDLLTGTESGPVQATIVKLLGELVAKV